MSGALGPKEYGLLLTDQRLIFVLEKASKAGVAAALGGVIGAAIAEAATQKREYVYADADPGTLARDEKNITVQNTSIQKLRMKRTMGGAYQMTVEYASDDGKARKLNGFLHPPQDMLAAKKAGGARTKVVLEEYAMKSQEALKLAVPPVVAMNSEWLS